MRLKCDLVVYLKCLLQIIHLYDDEKLHFLFFFLAKPTPRKSVLSYAWSLPLLSF